MYRKGPSAGTEVIRRMHINRDQLRLPNVRAVKRIPFIELKPGEYFRILETGEVFYCSRDIRGDVECEWSVEEKVFYAVDVVGQIPLSPTNNGLPGEFDEVDVLDRVTVRGNLP